MKIVKSTVLRDSLSDSIDTVSNNRDYLLVSRRGKINAALVDIELFEDLMALANKSYVKSIKKARQEYESGDIVSHEQAFGEV